MKDDELKALLEANQRLLLILGYASNFICERGKQLKSQQNLIEIEKYEWLMSAIENVVYLNKPLPPMP